MTTSVEACVITLKRREGVVDLLLLHRDALRRFCGWCRGLEYNGFSTGEVLELEWETPGQDGFDYRAVAVRRRG